MLDKQRCPWCGNELVNKISLKPSFRLDKYLRSCYICGKYSKHIEIMQSIISTLLFLLAILFIKQIGLYPLIAGLVINVICIHKSPYKREQKDNEKIPEEPIIGDASITWFSKEITGIRFLKLRIWNFYILPICFLDDNDQPKSQVGCIRIRKKRVNKKRCYELKLITDNLHINEIVDGDKFFLFQKKRKIASGMILKKYRE